jgi:hypothetical protein
MPHKTRALPDLDNSLLLIASEAHARRSVAKAASINSGALPILALLYFRYSQGQKTRPLTLYAAEIANKPLVRAYVRELAAAKMVQVETHRGRRWLAVTLAGCALASKYYRSCREGCRSIQSNA